MKNEKSNSEEKLKEKENKRKNIGQEVTLKSLSPSKDIDITHYENFLDDMFRLEDVSNVGVTGPYGSGKSSTIESYKIKNKERKFIHISLGKYDTDNDDEKAEPSKQELKRSTKEIEGKIINQLLHQVKTKRVPQAFAKVKKNNSSKAVIGWSLLVPLMIVLLMYVIMFNYWVSFVTTHELFSSENFTINPLTRVIVGALLTIFVGGLTYIFGEAQINRTIVRKISFRGNEIELYKNDKNSFFDEHLNEVVYLFENSDADVIVFEDLDRYNNPDVFRKLRELNQLINKRFSENLTARKPKNKKKLIFLYLIKDDIFVSKDRAKFFDLIIPIVPVVTSSNSYNKILDIFEEEIKEEDSSKSNQTEDKLSKSFLRKLSFYLDDMRLIINIYNEYKIYNATINTADLSVDKLLAVITYKNVFPRDFSDLQYNKGFLYTLINKKDSLLSNKIDEIDSKIELKEEKIKSLEKEKISSIVELQMIYLQTDNILVNSKTESEYGSRSVYVQEILNGKNLTKKSYNRDNYYNNRFVINMETTTLEEILEPLEQDDNYQQKKNLIEERDKGELENLRHSIENLQLEKKQTIVTPISELFDENIFKTKLNSEDFKEIKNNEYYNLLSFLIKESFIDENYNSYMNYFYDNDLKKEDIIFLRELYAGKINEPEYELNSLESIIEILENEDYSRKGILNNSIFEFLLKKEALLSEKSSMHTDPLLHEELLEKIKNILLVASQEKQVEFILELDSHLNYDYNEEKHISKRWIEILFTTWFDFSLNIISAPMLITQEYKYTIKRLLFGALKYLNVEQISVQNKNQLLTKYLEENSDILEFLKKSMLSMTTKNLFRNLESLNVEFIDISSTSIDREIVLGIMHWNLYQLNYNNIESIAKISEIIGKNINLKSFKEKNLTYIMQSNNEPLKKRVSDNLNDYIKLYLKFSNGVIYDSDITMLHVLNDASVENKNSYLKATKHRIENIKDIIDQSIWGSLLENDSVQGNFKNIVYYFIFSKKKWESELIEFVNRSHSEIQVNIEEISEKSFELEEFVDATIKLNDLDNDRYREIVGYSGHEITKLDKMSNNLPDSKIEILIDCSVLPIRGDVLRYVRTHYSKHMTQFALHNKERYMEIINENYDEKFESELSNILNSNIALSTKKYILSLLNAKNKISIKNINIKSDILSIILDQHLKESEIPTLFEVYSQYGFEVRDKILEIAKENIELMKSNDCDKRLVIKVLKSDLDIKIKRNLFISKISIMKYRDILNIVSTLNLSRAYEKLSTGKRIEFEKTEINVAIINHLEKIGAVSAQFLEDDIIFVIEEKSSKASNLYEKL